VTHALAMLDALTTSYTRHDFAAWQHLLTHHVRMHTGFPQISGRDLVYGRDDVIRWLQQDALSLVDAERVEAESGSATFANNRHVVYARALLHGTHARSNALGLTTGARLPWSTWLLGEVFEDRVYRLWLGVDHGLAARAAGIELLAAAQRLAASCAPNLLPVTAFGELAAGRGQLPPGDVGGIVLGAGSQAARLQACCKALNRRATGGEAAFAPVAKVAFDELIARVPDLQFVPIRAAQIASTRNWIALVRVQGHARRAQDPANRHGRINLFGTLEVAPHDDGHVQIVRLDFDALALEAAIELACR
jgi:hypothetical protein